MCRCPPGRFANRRSGRLGLGWYERSRPQESAVGS